MGGINIQKEMTLHTSKVVFTCRDIIMGCLQLVQLVNVPEQKWYLYWHNIQYSLDHALEAVIVLNLQHRVVEVLQVGHKVIDLGKGMLALSGIYRRRQRLQIIHMRLNASKVMLVVYIFSHREVHLLESVEALHDFAVLVFPVNLHDWIVQSF